MKLCFINSVRFPRTFDLILYEKILKWSFFIKSLLVKCTKNVDFLGNRWYYRPCEKHKGITCVRDFGMGMPGSRTE